MTTNASPTLYEWDERGMFYEDSRVTHDLSLRFVTHADYRALEEDHAELRIAYDAEYKRALRLEEELAALRARVGELVEADQAYDKAEMAWNSVHPNADREELTDKFRSASERRRLALEALK